MPKPEASSRRDRLDRDRQVGAALAVGLDELGDVHQVELVAREDQDLGRIGLEQPRQVLAHGVGGALVPVAVALRRLLGGQDVDEAVARRRRSGRSARCGGAGSRC